MAHEEIPITQGVRLLPEKKIEFRPYFYRYEDHGGATRAAAELGAPEDLRKAFQVREVEVAILDQI